MPETTTLAPRRRGVSGAVRDVQQLGALGRRRRARHPQPDHTRAAHPGGLVQDGATRQRRTPRQHRRRRREHLARRPPDGRAPATSSTASTTSTGDTWRSRRTGRPTPTWTRCAISSGRARCTTAARSPGHLDGRTGQRDHHRPGRHRLARHPAGHPTSAGVDYLEPSQSITSPTWKPGEPRACASRAATSCWCGPAVMPAARRRGRGTADVSSPGCTTDVAVAQGSRRRPARLGRRQRLPRAPVRGTGHPIHILALVAMGMQLLDNQNLDDLAAACAARSRWAFMLVIAPLKLVGGTASMTNPIAIF